MNAEEESPMDGASLGHELSLRVVLFHDAVAARLGVNTTEHKVLDLIGRHPGVSPTRLAQETGLSHAAITKITNRLVELGYVRRERDPSDGRKFALAVTPEHRQSMTGLMAPLIDGMSRVTSELTESERETVGRWLTGTVTALREATTKIRTHHNSPAVRGDQDLRHTP
ncbi:MarR family winged helix-turn-helix transcriptional regulator [Streptomyces sp. NPDC098101]|uniref:MarR family winged helix-turn-helix transcriptional regulator n=1 Tax=Streptomyces sp. NPDC098101 TaxID=3366096 RepID=UPI003821B141